MKVWWGKAWWSGGHRGGAPTWTRELGRSVEGVTPVPRRGRQRGQACIWKRSAAVGLAGVTCGWRWGAETPERQEKWSNGCGPGPFGEGPCMVFGLHPGAKEKSWWLWSRRGADRKKEILSFPCGRPLMENHRSQHLQHTSWVQGAALCFRLTLSLVLTAADQDEWQWNGGLERNSPRPPSGGGRMQTQPPPRLFPAVQAIPWGPGYSIQAIPCGPGYSVQAIPRSPGYSTWSRLFRVVQAILCGPGYSTRFRIFHAVQAIPCGPGYSVWFRLFHEAQAIPCGPDYSMWSRLFHEVHGPEATTSPGSLIEIRTLSPDPDSGSEPAFSQGPWWFLSSLTSGKHGWWFPKPAAC